MGKSAGTRPRAPAERQVGRATSRRGLNVGPVTGQPAAQPARVSLRVRDDRDPNDSRRVVQGAPGQILVSSCSTR